MESKLLCFYSNVGPNCCYSFKPPVHSKIIIYGFGPYGEYGFTDLFNSCEILDIYDMNFNNYGKKIKSPEFVNAHTFDYILVTVMNKDARNNVLKFLKNKGIDENKIIYIEYLNNV